MNIAWSDHTLAILLMLAGALVLGILLGYFLWGGFQRMYHALKGEKDKLHRQFVDLEKDYVSLKYQHDELKKDNSAMKVSLNSCEADKAILQNKLRHALEDGAPAEAAAPRLSPSATSMEGLFTDDNLQILEGIGPKMESALHELGIRKWSDLAAAENLKERLENNGVNTHINNPASWPKQAKLAADGNWEELIGYQKTLGGGLESTGEPLHTSKLEKLRDRKKGHIKDPE